MPRKTPESIEDDAAKKPDHRWRRSRQAVRAAGRTPTGSGPLRSQVEDELPLFVDEMDDRVGHAYSGMPARLYIIDRVGKVAYKSGRGPYGFKPDEMEQSLVMLLLDQQ